MFWVVNTKGLSIRFDFYKIMIKHVPLKHGWYYFYRIHEKKRDLLLEDLSNLKEYLNFVSVSCPNEYFMAGPRSSSLTFKLNNTKIVEVTGHEVSNLAREALVGSSKKEAHTKVELFLLEKDQNTVAVEVPIWIKKEELEDFYSLFKSDLPLTGHIDILRVEDGKVWIWDFKPKAKEEKYAQTQLFFYALMLSKRTDIPLDHFRCGYFDPEIAYIFKPHISAISKNKTISSFI